jgi:hypothetical protein
MLSDTRTLSNLPQQLSPGMEREPPGSATQTDLEEGDKSLTILALQDFCKIIAGEPESTIP